MANKEIDTGPLGTRSEIEIEFSEIRLKIEELCQTPVGRDLAGSLRPSPDPAQVGRWLEETDEIRRQLEQGWDPPAIGSAGDIFPLLLRVRKGAFLRPEELVQVSLVLECAESIRRYLKSRSDFLPRVREHFGPVAGIPGIHDQIRKSIDPSGTIRDGASSELARLRRKKDSIEEEIRERIQELVGSPALEDILQDQYFTLRAGRYVLPVKSERRSDLKGIIHDFSSSGATVFIEPEPVVDLNNHLRVAEGEIVQEEERILQKITFFIQEEVERLEEILRRIGEFDLLLAKARLSRILGGGEVRISSFPEFSIRLGRHPLLVLQKPEVVANDLALDGEHRGVIISGPNTGGKTVTLKMVGLSAAMFQSGIIPALGDGSRLPVFGRILAVIGEGQSLARGLSAFAAEVVRVREVLEHVGPGSLVILDDLFGGTDPREGAILARALLRVLVERGGVVLVTTHFPELKTLPLEDSRFEAAAVEFDLKKMAPTYRVRRGVPGRSYGLEIADLLGLGQDVVSSAGREMGGEGKLDEILSRLHRIERERALLREELEGEKKSLQDALRGLEREKEEISRKKGSLLSEAREEFRAVVERMEREGREILQKMRKSRTRKQAGERVEELKSVEERLRREAGLIQEPAGTSGLVPAEKGPVWVKTLRKEGTLISPGPEDSLVQVGSLKIRVSNRDLASLAEEEDRAGKGDDLSRGRRWKEAVLADDDEPVDFRSEDNSLDVRGENVEDALLALEKFLDRAFLQGLGRVYIIHGSGSGKLREGIRKYLSGSPYAESFRPAEDHQGGQGVTVIELK